MTVVRVKRADKKKTNHHLAPKARVLAIKFDINWR